MASPLLVTNQVGRSFGSTVALDSLTLSVFSGEFLSILGPSGSGKSTTLNLVAGFDFPSRGTILINGRDVTWAPAYARDIGMVFQNYALFPHMTARENVAFPLRARRRSRVEIERAVDEALELVQLGGVGERLPAQLSGGQQQRVALARAIVYRPALLLMDEPLGALDRKLRGDMQVEIKRLHRELGTTVVYVTHDQDEALSMSDRVAILRRGRLEQVGTPHEVYSKPATRFVASFVGDTNFLAGIVERDGVTCRLPVLDLSLPLTSFGPRPAGTRLTASFRPEHLRLANAHGRKGAVIEETLFLGSVVKSIVSIGSAKLTVVEPARGRLAFEPGQPVIVAVDADACVFFTEDENDGDIAHVPTLTTPERVPWTGRKG